ncbi:MAG: hypothetical protein ACYC9H_02120, partial [Sulfuricaulis sp.]
FGQQWLKTKIVDLHVRLTLQLKFFALSSNPANSTDSYLAQKTYRIKAGSITSANRGGADKNLDYLEVVQVFVRTPRGSILNAIQHPDTYSAMPHRFLASA